MTCESLAKAPQPPEFARLRSLMPVAERVAYLDHAAVSPLPAPAQAAIEAWARDTAQFGDLHWPVWAARVEAVRAAGARLLACPSEEIALVRNTTEGISLVAEGFPWRAGDNVVTLADEFPSNVFPWMNLAPRGVETRLVPVDGGRVDLDRVAMACDGRTRIVAVSWVGYASGWRLDVPAVAEVAHRAGAYLFLDAIQGLGVFPLDPRRDGVDFLAADGHKWLLGPEGAGLCWLRREHLDLLRPVGVGWNSVVQAGDFSRLDFQLRPTAARYEGGTYPVAPLVGLGESLALLAEWGPAALGARIVELADLACERLAAAGATIESCRDPVHASGIVRFDWPGHDPARVRRRCVEAGVALSCRAGRLRISPHAYNTPEDLDRLLDALPR